MTLCDDVCGSCSDCGNCGRSLTITPPERDFLLQLAQTPFLPIARRLGDEEPVYLENGEEQQTLMSRLLLTMERKGLISLDYRIPMDRYPPCYDRYPVKGSLSLTTRGQQVLDLLEIQGWENE